MRNTLLFSVLALLSITAACGDDEGSEADRVGVGAQCASTPECPEVDLEGDAGVMRLECLTQFNGGYCGLSNCADSTECPDRSVCVAHDDGQSYCFRTCTDKAECNANRDVEVEASCVSDYDLQDPSEPKVKVCRPSNSGL